MLVQLFPQLVQHVTVAVRQETAGNHVKVVAVQHHALVEVSHVFICRSRMICRSNAYLFEQGEFVLGERRHLRGVELFDGVVLGTLGRLVLEADWLSVTCTAVH